MLTTGNDANRCDFVTDGDLPRPSSPDRQKMNVSIVGRHTRSSIYICKPAMDRKLREIRRRFPQTKLSAQYSSSSRCVNHQARPENESGFAHSQCHPVSIAGPIEINPLHV